MNALIMVFHWVAGISPTQSQSLTAKQGSFALTVGIIGIFLSVVFGITIAHINNLNVPMHIICVLAAVVAFRFSCQVLMVLFRLIAGFNIKEFFVKVTGADHQVLQDLNNRKELNAYTALGVSMFVPALLGLMTMSYILVSIFETSNLVAFIGGLVWASIIFSVDMVLVRTMKRGQNGRYPIGSILIRILLALIIGVVVATPIELAVFDREIKEQLAFEKVSADKEADAEMDAELSGVDRKIAAEEAKVQAMYGEYINEVNNSIGGRKAGHGIEATKKETHWQAKKAEFDNVLKPSLEKEKVEIRKKFTIRKGQWVQTQAKGLGGRLEALNRTSERKPTVFWAHVLLSCFFVFLELVPVISKLMMKSGAYDRRITDLELQSERESMAALAMATATANANQAAAEADAQALLNAAKAKANANQAILEAEAKADAEIASLLSQERIRLMKDKIAADARVAKKELDEQTTFALKSRTEKFDHYKSEVARINQELKKLKGPDKDSLEIPLLAMRDTLLSECRQWR